MCLGNKHNYLFFQQSCNFVTARPALELPSFRNKSSVATVRHFCSCIVCCTCSSVIIIALKQKCSRDGSHRYIHLSSICKYGIISLFPQESQLPACPSYTAAWPLFCRESQLPACPFSAAAWPLSPLQSQLQPGLSPQQSQHPVCTFIAAVVPPYLW